MASHRAPSSRARRAATVGALAAASLAVTPALPALAGEVDSPAVTLPSGGNDSGSEVDCTPLIDVDADLSDEQLADLELLCTDFVDLESVDLSL